MKISCQPKLDHRTYFAIGVHITIQVVTSSFQNSAFPGRPSMDILVRSWQDLAKILARIARCHGTILSREPCFQENFYCKILFGKKKIRKEVNKNQHFCRFILLDIQTFVSNV